MSMKLLAVEISDATDDMNVGGGYDTAGEWGGEFGS